MVFKILMLNLYLDCDKACKSCNADGPDNCIECTDGYSYKDGVCVGEFFLPA